MAITDAPRIAAPTAPISATPPTVSAPAAPVSAPGRWASAWSGRDQLMTALSLIAAAGGVLVGIIGFAMSYSALATVARSWGFSPGLAPWFPIGVDASIIAFLALDLYLIRQNTPWPLLRLAAHTMTGATIWFNAASQGAITEDPVRAASHGIMPLLFVIGVEAARRLVIKKAQLEAGSATDRIPLHRWLLAPVATPRFYRRMRLHGVRSYPEMIRRARDLRAYEQWLSRKYDGDLAKASQDERLPMTMAPHGYTVAEALAMPDQQERAAQERAEEAEQRRREAATRKELAEKKEKAKRLKAQGDLEAVEAQVEASTGQARAHAKAQVSAAERAAELEQEALDNAVVAEARARAAGADRKEAEAREAEARADLEKAELERQAAEQRKLAAEADQAAAAEAQAIETQEIAEARRAAAKADAEAVELESQAAQKRREIAEADQVAEAQAQAIETQEIAEAREAAAKADQAAAEAEQAAAETRLAAAETDRKKLEERGRHEELLADIARSLQAAAEAEQAAAETRLAAAETEQRAAEAEDLAKLSRRDRAIRKVARMALAAGVATTGLDAEEILLAMKEVVTLAAIQREADVSSASTASEYRAAAAQLLADGYTPN